MDSGPFSGRSGGQNCRCAPSGRVAHFITIFSLQIQDFITIIIILPEKISTAARVLLCALLNACDTAVQKEKLFNSRASRGAYT
eukprot:1146748-Pelagomonas_calceolata.AAC.4